MDQLEQYRQMAMDLKLLGHRGDMDTREIIGYNYQIDPTNPWFSLDARKLNVPFIMKELVWYLQGDMTDPWIGEHAGVWKSVLDHDGRAVSNYGHEAFNRRGMTRVINLLMEEPMTRRAVLYFGQNSYVLPHTTVKDQPCANSIHFMVRRGMLRTIISQRSQDFIYGVSGDAVFFTLLTNMVAAALQVDAAPIEVQVASFHHYPKHEKMVEAIITSDGYHIDWLGHQMFAREANAMATSGLSAGGPVFGWIMKEAQFEQGK